MPFVEHTNSQKRNPSDSQDYVVYFVFPDFTAPIVLLHALLLSNFDTHTL